MAEATSNTRIMKNTVFLYFRMALLMFISFYTSRIILQALGAEDLGVYNVAGGIVAMFSFVNSSMTLASNRFLAFAIGKDDIQLLNKTFSISIVVHTIIALIILILAETAGLWYFYHYLNIPESSMGQAMWVYQLSVAATMLGIINVPYTAMVTAHEDMKAYAYLSLGEGLLKLGIAFLITISIFANIKVYAILTFCLSTFIFIFWRSLVHRKYRYIHFVRQLDGSLFKDMFRFISWQVVGSLSFMLRNQGANLVLNYFFGPILNTARYFSVQVNGGVTSLVSNFQQATNPQIVKNFAKEDISAMQRLLYRSSKISFILIFIFAYPVIWEAEPILTFWLKDVPPYALIFVRLALIATLFDSLSGTLVQTVLATGNIKKYTQVVTIIMLSYILWVYLFFRAGYPPESMLYVEIGIYFIVFITRLIMCRRLYHLDTMGFLKEVTMREVLICAVSTIIIFTLHNVLGFHLGMIGDTMVYFLICVFTGFYLGLNSHEREWALAKIKARFQKN